MSKNMSWDEFISESSPISYLESALIKKAERMYEFVEWVMKNNVNFDDSLMGDIQHTTELYMGGILETLTGKPLGVIYGNGRIPHDVSKVYKDLFFKGNIEKLNVRFMKGYDNALRDIYYDWRDTRFLLDEMDVRKNQITVVEHAETMEKTKEFCELFLERYNEYLLKQQKENSNPSKKQSNKECLGMD